MPRVFKEWSCGTSGTGDGLTEADVLALAVKPDYEAAESDEAGILNKPDLTQSETYNVAKAAASGYVKGASRVLWNGYSYILNTDAVLQAARGNTDTVDQAVLPSDGDGSDASDWVAALQAKEEINARGTLSDMLAASAETTQFYIPFGDYTGLYFRREGFGWHTDGTFGLPITIKLPVTLVIFAGQSNSVGWSSDPENADTPVNGLGYEYVEPNGLIPIGTTQIGRLQGGSQAAWVKGWTDGGGAPCIVVNVGENGSSILPDAAQSGGTWNLSDVSSHYPSAKAKIDAAAAFASASGFDVVNTHVVWIQGEQDAVAFNGTTVNAAAYQAELELIMAQFLADGADQFFVSELGMHAQVGYAKEPDWAEVRTAQNDAAANVQDAYMVFTGAKDFVADGKMVDDLHYTQAGYNDIGILGAAAALSAIGGQAVALESGHLEKYADVLQNPPEVSGFKRISFTTEATSAFVAFYGGLTTPNAPTWLDTSGENDLVSAVSPTLTWGSADEKNVVLYVSESTGTNGTVVLPANFLQTFVVLDDSIKIKTINAGNQPDFDVLDEDLAKLVAPTGLDLLFSGDSNWSLTNDTLTAIANGPSVLAKLIATKSQSEFLDLTLAPSLIRIDMIQLGFDSAQVNQMLADLVANGLSNGVANFGQFLSGVHSAAPPTGQGITDKATLEGLGWFVFTD